MREEFADRATEDLGKLGIIEDAIQDLALAEHIEVELYGPAKSGAGGGRSYSRAASEIPWEYLLSAVTKSAGRVQSLLISRCLSKQHPR